MPTKREIAEKILSSAQIAINGPNPWDITVHDDRIYARVLLDKNLGLGEGYMDGWWACPQIDEFMCRILKSSVDKQIMGGIKYWLNFLPDLVFNLQSGKRAWTIANRHYNLDNELFLSFLDPYNQYSCAYFKDSRELDTAQETKLDLICKKLALSKSDRVLDIGCGWGGFAKYAAQNYGCSVTGVNISEAQLQYARQFCKGLPVEFMYCDYRDLGASYDKIVSVGMFEHVGRRNYRTFMQVAHRCLKEDGIFLLHTIGGNETQKKGDPWITKYIFPNSMLPSMAQITKSIEGLFVIEDIQNLGPDYDKTLMAWHQNFQKAWPVLKHKYDDRFKRMWDYYLLSCAGNFRSRVSHVWQIVLTKYGTKQPDCRFSIAK